jgi:hypothetical protein
VAPDPAGPRASPSGQPLRSSSLGAAEVHTDARDHDGRDFDGRGLSSNAHAPRSPRDLREAIPTASLDEQVPPGLHGAELHTDAEVHTASGRGNYDTWAGRVASDTARVPTELPRRLISTASLSPRLTPDALAHGAHAAEVHTNMRACSWEDFDSEWRFADVLVHFAAPEAGTRAASRGYRTRPASRRGPPDAAVRAMQLFNRLLFQCPSWGCGALVSLVRAHTQAKGAGRMDMADGDACYACSRHRRPGRLVDEQLRLAGALLQGRRLLIRRPASLHDRKAILLNSAETRRVASRIALRLRGEGGAPP